MIATNEASIISDLFYLLDTGVRDDLNKGNIADERDYVSRLMTHINYPFGIFIQLTLCGIKLKSKWFAITNKRPLEGIFGCDSMIVFKIKNKIKVGLFEAKWPRMISKPNYKWDYIQKSAKASHFTDQINRQAKWTNQAAIWEMFFNEAKVGIFNSPFDKNASTCVRHQFASQFVNTSSNLQRIWKNTDLKALIQSEQTTQFNGTNETNLKKIIFDILTCKLGKTIGIKPTDKSFTLTALDDKERAVCPLLSLAEENGRNKIIEDFMIEHGLSFFQQINIETDDNEH